MNRLTQREQLVLALLVVLFIVGWTVKLWRQSEVKDRTEAVTGH